MRVQERTPRRRKTARKRAALNYYSGESSCGAQVSTQRDR
jgi:hypothetical protein